MMPNVELSSQIKRKKETIIASAWPLIICGIGTEIRKKGKIKV